MTVLITGFDPFGGESINPAYEAVKLLDNEIKGHKIIKLEIPTVFNKSIDCIKKAIEDTKPDIVICVGQAGGRAKLSLEYVGINLNEARIPDNESQSPSGPIALEGETAYFTNLPVKAMHKMISEAGIPVYISYTAGTYVCNHVMYGLLHYINVNKLKIKGGFIHVPYLPEQVVNKGPLPFMSLDMIAKGLELAIVAAIEYEHDLDGISGELH